MKIKYNGTEVKLLDVRRVKGGGWRNEKQVAAELRLVNDERTFQVMLRGGYVDADPVELIDGPDLSMKEVFERFAPVNMTVLDHSYFAKLKPGTWLHDCLVGDPAYRAESTTVGNGTMRFANGHKREVFYNVRPTTPEEREEAVKRFQARNLQGQSARPGVSGNQAAASPTARLESEIIRILARDFTATTARPTASEFYQEYVINGRTIRGLARAKQWSERTMKDRKAKIEAHLAEELEMTVDLDLLRTGRRKSGRLVYMDPSVIERTRSDEMEQDED